MELNLVTEKLDDALYDVSYGAVGCACAGGEADAPGARLQPVEGGFDFGFVPELMSQFLFRDNVTDVFDVIGPGVLTGYFDEMCGVGAVESTDHHDEIQVSCNEILNSVLSLLGGGADGVEAAKVLV